MIKLIEFSKVVESDLFAWLLGVRGIGDILHRLIGLINSWRIVSARSRESLITRNRYFVLRRGSLVTGGWWVRVTSVHGWLVRGIAHHRARLVVGLGRRSLETGISRSLVRRSSSRRLVVGSGRWFSETCVNGCLERVIVGWLVAGWLVVGRRWRLVVWRWRASHCRACREKCRQLIILNNFLKLIIR